MVMMTYVCGDLLIDSRPLQGSTPLHLGLDLLINTHHNVHLTDYL